MGEIILSDFICENCENRTTETKRIRYSRWNCVPDLYSCASRTSSLECLICPRSHYWSLLIMFLALFQITEAYVTVPISGLCKDSGSETLRITPTTATSLVLEASSNGTRNSCKIELVASETHSISLLFTRRRVAGKRANRVSFLEDAKIPKCPLIVSFPLLRPEFVADEEKLLLDLCSEEALKTVEHQTDLLPSLVTLEWAPRVEETDEILASEIVLAAVGRGEEMCNRPGQFTCGSEMYCISKDLVCDGKKNCPFEGSDEETELCSSGGNSEKSFLGKSVPDKNHHIQNWEFIASEFLKKLSSKDHGNLRKMNLASSTEKSTVLWSDEGTVETSNTESLPDVLNHYGPWGYLMLGMLICGTVLMFCGLWECCCRRPKAPATNATGPTLLIINQGAQQSDLEPPQTPGPPRYEDLDQPPSYAALFPSSKPDTSTNPLPITIPIVDSLSNLLTNSTSSQTNSNLDSSNSVAVSADVFTIDLQNSNDTLTAK